PGGSGTAALPGLAALMARAQELQNNLNQLKQQADRLKAQGANARAARRAELARQLATVQSQMELAQSRLDSYNAIIQFQTTAVSVANQGSGLPSQIDALERSVPQLNAPAKGATSAPPGAPALAAVTTRNAPEPAAAPDNGLLGTIEALISLGKERS